MTLHARANHSSDLSSLKDPMQSLRELFV